MEKGNYPVQAQPPYPVQPGFQPHGSQFSQPLNPQNLQGNFVPPPPTYDGHYPQQVTTSVLVGSQPASFGPDAQALTCPHCHAQVITKVDSKASTKTHLFALLLCCCVCTWPCAWIPYCMDSCQNRNHHCPHCGAYLGTYEN